MLLFSGAFVSCQAPPSTSPPSNARQYEETSTCVKTFAVMSLLSFSYEIFIRFHMPFICIPRGS